MKKKLITLGIAALLLFSVAGLTACNLKGKEYGAELTSWEWSNNNAINVTIKPEYINSIYRNYKNITKAFQPLNLKNVLITRKNGNKELNLLLILRDGESQAIAIDVLCLDNRVESVVACGNVPFKNESTLSLNPISSIVNVGEILTIKREVAVKYYQAPFNFDKIIIAFKNVNPDKEYKPADFPKLKLSSVDRVDGITNIGNFKVMALKLTLASPGYFSVLNTVNYLALDNNVLYVETIPMPAIDQLPDFWHISDISIAKFIIVKEDYDNSFGDNIPSYFVESEFGIVSLKGIKPGTIIITYVPSFGGSAYTTNCEINVVQ